MRSTHPIIAVVTVFSLVGCSDAAQAPTELTLPPAYARGGAEVMPNQVIEVPLDNTIAIECAGEDVRFQGTLTFRIHEVSTPSGVRVLHVTIPASGSDVTATGASSGTMWTLARGASVQTIVQQDGETKVVNVSRNETYVAEDGSSLRLHHNLHVRMRDGEPVEIETEEWTCTP